MSSSVKYWAVVPAAGVGRRMQSDIPKQYLKLDKQTVLEHTLQQLLQHTAISGAVVAISEGDPYWSKQQIKSDKPVLQAEGGAERCHSVLNALYVLSQQADDNDWVLVHDAARPCLRQQDVSRLIDSLSEDEVGGLLAIPVRDTMKRAEENCRVIDTVERNGLWHALTPQMFRLGLLRNALEQAIEDEALVTDESSAMEIAGYQPLLIEGSADNIKITRPEDLSLATFFIQQQQE